MKIPKGAVLHHICVQSIDSSLPGQVESLLRASEYTSQTLIYTGNKSYQDTTSSYLTIPPPEFPHHPLLSEHVESVTVCLEDEAGSSKGVHLPTAELSIRYPGGHCYDDT